MHPESCREVCQREKEELFGKKENEGKSERKREKLTESLITF